MADKTLARQIGENLERLRKERQFTQKELAGIAGIPLSSYTGYAAGLREPDISKLQRLAKALGTTINELTGDDVIFQYRYQRALDLARAAILAPEVKPDGSVILSIFKFVPRYTGADIFGAPDFDDRVQDFRKKGIRQERAKVTTKDATHFVELMELVEEFAMSANLNFRAALITYLKDFLGITFPDDFDLEP